MKRTSGFTLIELMVVIAILGILAAVIMPNLNGFFGHFQAKAEDEMREYVQDMYKPAGEVNVSCKKRDTDGDGNRRCSARFADKHGMMQMVQAECDHWGGCSELIKPTVRNTINRYE